MSRKTSHKKNRPFDFKLIDLIEPHHILYVRTMNCSSYEAKKLKEETWTRIADEIGADVNFCLKRWENLRSQFHKEWQNCRRLCPTQGIIKGSRWPYLHRLKFLESHMKCNRSKVQEAKWSQKIDKTTCSESEEHSQNVLDKNVQTDVTSVKSEIEASKDEVTRNSSLEAEETSKEEASKRSNEATLTKMDKSPMLKKYQNLSTLANIKSIVKHLPSIKKNRAKLRILAYLYKVRTLSANNQSIVNVQI